MGTKVITEADLRNDLTIVKNTSYYVPSGKILSPAAKEYLRENKIAVIEAETEQIKKPEQMTHLNQEQLVLKSHPRIIFRGKLDALQAKIILVQTVLDHMGNYKALVDELQDIVKILMEVMRCEVLEKEIPKQKILGLTAEELREQSHNPEKFYQVKQMIMPDHTKGIVYAMINNLRTEVRVTEIAAVGAWKEREDFIQVFNRLSSAMHIIMCRLLAEYYQK